MKHQTAENLLESLKSVLHFVPSDSILRELAIFAIDEAEKENKQYLINDEIRSKGGES